MLKGDQYTTLFFYTCQNTSQPPSVFACSQYPSPPTPSTSRSYRKKHIIVTYNNSSSVVDSKHRIPDSGNPTYSSNLASSQQPI